MLFKNRKETDKLLAEIKEIASYLWERGWSEKNAGNISLLLPEKIEPEALKGHEIIRLEKTQKAIAGKCYFITATGKRMRDLAKKPLDNGVFIQLNEKGNGYWVIQESELPLEPSSELPSHLGIHNLIAERQSGEIVVIHTHATEIIALTQDPAVSNSTELNNILWGMHPETMVFIPKGVGMLPYILPGTQTIADATVNSFREYDIVVWKKHGIFAIGKSISDTFDNIDIVCKSAKVWFLCKSAGITPEGLSGPELDELRELVKKFNR